MTISPVRWNKDNKKSPRLIESRAFLFFSAVYLFFSAISASCFFFRAARFFRCNVGCFWRFHSVFARFSFRFSFRAACFFCWNHGCYWLFWCAMAAFFTFSFRCFTAGFHFCFSFGLTVITGFSTCVFFSVLRLFLCKGDYWKERQHCG